MTRRIPAGSGEKMQYLVHEYNDNTIRFVLQYPQSLDPDRMLAAVRLLTDGVDILHASFIPGRIGAAWEIHDTYDDADVFCHISDSPDPLKDAFDRALLPVTPQHKTKLHCTLITGYHDSALVLTLSHLCMDGSDGKYLLAKLAEAYRAVSADGSRAALTVKNGSRAAEQVYKGLPFLNRLRLLKDPRTGIKSVFPFPSAGSGEAVVLRRSIPADIMARAAGRAKSAGATVNDLLLTSCYHAFADTDGVDSHAPMSIMSMMDLRRHCPGQDTQGLCNLSGSLATALPHGVCPDFRQTLADIAAQTRRAKDDPLGGLYGMPLLHGSTRLFPLGFLMRVASRLYGSMSVGLTNLGRIDRDTLRMGDAVPTGCWFGGPVKQKPGVQISVVSLGGVCTLGIWGYAAKEDIPALQRMLDSIAAYVESYAAL